MMNCLLDYDRSMQCPNPVLEDSCQPAELLIMSTTPKIYAHLRVLFKKHRPSSVLHVPVEVASQGSGSSLGVDLCFAL